MTREDAVRWHAALASASGQLSGSIARRAHSRRLIQDLLAMLRPVLKEMETDDLQYQALDNIEKNPPAEQCGCGIECQDIGGGRCRYEPKRRVARPVKRK